MLIPAETTEYGKVHSEIISLLEAARRQAVRSVNALMTATYWEIGRRIVEYEQGGSERAGYGIALIKRLGTDLTKEYGRGFGWRNLTQMRTFYQAWPAELILQTLSAKSSSKQSIHAVDSNNLEFNQLSAVFPLPWSAYVCLLSLKTPAARTFYETEALRCGWSVRQLSRQINSQFYERIVLSRNKAAMLEKVEHADEEPDDFGKSFKDPFVLEFLNLKDEYSETDLEDALIRHLSDFMLELGDDFAYVGRQRRLRLDDTWFRVDLLLFHRRLKSLVVIDLKVGKFSYADAGQMHLYLNYAREHWMKPGENPPIGLILCAGKGAAEVHYALDGLPNKVLAAEYHTVLPDTTLLAEELQRTHAALEAKHLP